MDGCICMNIRVLPLLEQKGYEAIAVNLRVSGTDTTGLCRHNIKQLRVNAVVHVIAPEQM